MLDEDLFWVPATEEESENLGELAMDNVRKRKGLVVQRRKLMWRSRRR